MFAGDMRPAQGNDENAVDVDDVMAQVQAAAAGHTDGTWQQNAESVVFRVSALRLRLLFADGVVQGSAAERLCGCENRRV
jgi:hypothetical protein